MSHRPACPLAPAPPARWPRGVLEVRKVKSGQERLFFLSFCHASAGPDVRLKVVAQRTYRQARAGCCSLWVWG